MMPVRIAIVSKNATLISFYKLELEYLGGEVDVLSAESELSEKYDLIICDDQSFTQVSDSYVGTVYRVTDDHTATGDSYTLSWPTSVLQIRKIYDEASRIGDIGADKVLAKQDSNTVYVADESECVVMLKGVRIKLSSTEFSLLKLLCASRGDVVPREQIMRSMGAEDGNISDVYICHLRKKLETPIGKKLIFTVRNKGYRTDLTFAER